MPWPEQITGRLLMLSPPRGRTIHPAPGFQPSRATMARGLCQDCIFWDRVGASSLGECHRYGPAVRITGSALWPPTVADSGCGEFEVRPAVVVPADPGVN